MPFNTSSRIKLALMLLACLSAHVHAGQNDTDAAAKPAQGIESAQRALPTRSNTVSEPAHYQHVYIDTKEPNAGSLQTISLGDAVRSNVLASSELQAKPLAKIAPESLSWVVLDRGFSRPSSIEGVGGAGLMPSTFVEVNFPLNETVPIQPERLKSLTDIAKRVGGIFFVVAYADESGIEASNKLLSDERAKAVAQALMDAGVNPTRVKAVGAGISRLYPGLDANRRASVTFRVVE